MNISINYQTLKTGNSDGLKREKNEENEENERNEEIEQIDGKITIVFIERSEIYYVDTVRCTLENQTGSLEHF